MTDQPPQFAGDRLDTFPKFLVRNAKSLGARSAIREKDLGIWQTWSWADVFDEVRSYSIGLSAIGLKRGDKIAIVGTNRPRLYWSISAAQALGAVPVPVYADSVADEMAYVLDHAEVAFAVCEDQEQVDKVLSISDKVKSLKCIIYDDPRGLKDYSSENLYDFTDVQTMGARAIADDPNAAQAWLDGLNNGKGEDLAVMLYTSGTTGTPKGVMLSYDNLVAACLAGNTFDSVDQMDEVLTYLPLAWVGDHVISYGQGMTAGFCICCPESGDTVTADRREIAPTYFFAPPRIFEIMLTSIMVRMQDAGSFKQRMFHYFMDVAKRYGEKLLNGEAVGISGRVLYGLGEFFVYGPLKNQMGFTRVKVAYTAGEAIGPEIFSFFRSLGLNLKQLYGQTEASVYVTAQPDGEIYPDTVGTALPGVELKIAENGEVLYRSPGVFVGYYNNEEATNETKTEDGWVHTGDAGFTDSRGHLKIIDRAKDVGKLKAGSLFAPKYIENKLKFFPNIKEAVTFGHERDFVTAFVNIDLASVGNWAERNNVIYASYQELAANDQVYNMIREHVTQVNKDLASESQMSGSQIHRFLILHKELDPDDGELTRTMKVRRRAIADRYQSLIDALYDGSSEKAVTTEVTFEDGRKGTISAVVTICDVELTSSTLEAAE